MSDAARFAGVRPTLSILICTMNRPRELRRCLTALTTGEAQPGEILVSDDGPDGRETLAICSAFPTVRYFQGPRRGLCANRNAVIRNATTEFVSLLDDDVVVSRDFISFAYKLIIELPPKTLVTGTLIDAGHPIVPGNPSFLGFFGKPPDGRLKNINLTCNVLPRAIFAEATFDEMIAYGYEDMDLCSRLMSRGYTIRHESGLVATHLPPSRSAALEEERLTQAARARFYTSVKRYLLYERSVPRLLAFIVVAPTHRVLHAVKNGRWSDVLHAMRDIGFAVRAGFRERARQRGHLNHQASGN